MVTALFVDVVGSTALGEQFDPEDFRSIVREAVARAIAVCERYGGVIENVAGDGALALFGAPVAHEDDPERAVLAGLGIVEEVATWAREVRRRWDVEALDVRVGVETGPVVVGVQGAAVASGSMGDTLNTAARIQAQAKPGTVLVGNRTKRLVEGLFTWGPDRELALKGKQQPVLACEALGGRPEPAAHRGRSKATRTVGREAELERAERAIDGAVSGSAQVLLLRGEAGVGKTHLLAEIHEHFATAASSSPVAEPELWLEGRCASYGEALPYSPIRGMLRSWLAGSDGGPVDERELRRLLSPILAGAEESVVPRLAPLLGLNGGGDGPDRQPTGAEHGRHQIHDAVARLVEALAARSPVALALEDVHWADRSSVDLLVHLVTALRSCGLLIVATGRPEDSDALTRLSETAEENEQLTEIRLGALAADAERSLLTELIGTDSLPDELERMVLERAEGNPLFLEEIALSLIETGAVVSEPHGWRHDPSVEIELPETLEKIVLARIDRLPEHCHAVLGAAAVIGRHFEEPLLELVTGSDPVAALSELADMDLIRADGPRGAHRFRHFVIREVAYNTLLRSDRRRLHRQTAEALATKDRAESGDLGLIARHFRSAGELEQAIDYRLRAADAAARIPAFPEALAHCEDGIAIAEELGLERKDRRLRRLLYRRAEARGLAGDFDGARRDAELALAGARAAGVAQEQISSLMVLAFADRFTGDWSGAHNHVSRALEIAEGIGDSATQTDILRQLSILASNQLQFDRALVFAERAQRLATASGNEAEMASALDALKLTALFIGDLEQLETSARTLVEFHRSRDDHTMSRQWALVEWAHVPLLQGRFDEAGALLDEAWKDAKRWDWYLFEPIWLSAWCWLERSRGNHAEAHSHGRRAVDSAAERKLVEWEAWARANLGWALLDAGQDRPAVAELEAGLEVAESAGAPAQRIRCAALLAEARQRIGSETRSGELADLAESLLSKVSAPPGQAWLWGGHATVALARTRLGRGDAARARALVEPLAAASLRAGWQELAADAQVLLGRAALAEGRGREALELLERSLAGAGDHPAVAARAREALAAL